MRTSARSLFSESTLRPVSPRSSRLHSCATHHITSRQLSLWSPANARHISRAHACRLCLGIHGRGRECPSTKQTHTRSANQPINQ